MRETDADQAASLPLSGANMCQRTHDEVCSQHGLVPMTRTPGTITSFHAKPYLLEPEMTLDVALHLRPSPAGEIGRVIGGDTTGARRREVGQAQAWYYPADHTIVVWECFLGDRYRENDPLADIALREVWHGFEQTLVARPPVPVTSSPPERTATTARGGGAFWRTGDTSRSIRRCSRRLSPDSKRLGFGDDNAVKRTAQTALRRKVITLQSDELC